ncbi:proton-coupled folate transporter-like isoform X2 [Pararge aegeria]|uniref:proton-coupled folate transporter-like isoform X2 n=1 Tax=Pararge aegeria TaxID=116150 RepID=UPI0019D0E074|nr:proton-coupled folate transporter-like isoform X2 [Pararge aegeria]
MEKLKTKEVKELEDLGKEEINESSPLKCDHETIEKKEKSEKLSFIQRLKIIKANTTVEPILACYIMPSVLASLATQNLNLEKACLVNLNYSSEICDALKSRQTENYTEYEEKVQTLIAGIQAWKNVVQTAIPVLIILFVGAWSDKTGKRKACILMPIVGEFITSLVGGWYTNFIGVFSYIGDITSPEDRTYRIGIANLCMSLGYPIGSALSGVLLTWIGYYGIFSLSASLYLFSLVYGYFYLEDPSPKPRDKKYLGVFGFFREFFDVGLVMETFRVAFKKDDGNRRLRVCLLLIVVCVVFGPMQGEFSILYLFARFRFNWDEVKFSMWSTYSIITNLLGTAFSISLFSNYLKLDDTLLGIISNMSKIIASFAYAFARNDFEIYLAPLLEILNGTSFIAMRSIATKLVSGEEFGKVNSLFGLAEAMTPLIYGPLYSKVYVATLNVLPGAVFLLGALLTLPAIAIFGWLYLEHKKDRLKNNQDIKIGDKDKC